MVIYGLLRLFSFLHGPITPLQPQTPINTAVAVIIAILVAYLIVKNDERGWYLVAGELILGGAGGFLSIGPVALRTCLLVISSIIFYGRLVIAGTIKQTFINNKKVCLVISLTIAAAGLSATRGLVIGHGTAAVAADFIPYLFLLYYLPLTKLLQSVNFQNFAGRSVAVAVVCNLIFVLITLAGFSSEVLAMQGDYYHWFRDVALGKITDVDNGFFRIVLNEHLLLVPIFLLFLKQFLDTQSKKYLWTVILILPILAVNITRIYLVALAIGILFLFNKNYWKRWLAWSTASVAIFIMAFTTIHLVANKDHTLGLDLLGLRLQSVARPMTEDSSLSRLILLPKILDKIKQHPLWGTGLGDTVTAYSPILKQAITTTNFDWGYLEIMAEMGVLGAAAWIFLILISCKILFHNHNLAPFIAILAVNITSPALFHVLGILLIIYLLATARASAGQFPALPHSVARPELTKVI